MPRLTAAFACNLNVSPALPAKAAPFVPRGRGSSKEDVKASQAEFCSSCQARYPACSSGVARSHHATGPFTAPASTVVQHSRAMSLVLSHAILDSHTITWIFNNSTAVASVACPVALSSKACQLRISLSVPIGQYFKRVLMSMSGVPCPLFSG